MSGIWNTRLFMTDTPDIGANIFQYWKKMALELGFDQRTINVIDCETENDVKKCMKFLSSTLSHSMVTPEQFVNCKSMRENTPILRNELITKYNLNCDLSVPKQIIQTHATMPDIGPRPNEYTLKTNQSIIVCHKLPNGYVTEQEIQLVNGRFSVTENDITTFYNVSVSH